MVADWVKGMLKKKLKNGSDFRFEEFEIVILLTESGDCRKRGDLREKDEYCNFWDSDFVELTNYPICNCIIGCWIYGSENMDKLLGEEIYNSYA